MLDAHARPTGRGLVIVWFLALVLVVALGVYTIVRLVRSWRSAR